MVDVGTAPGAAAELDPRVERSRRVILEAVLDALGEVGYGALTIEAVAARAGVGKSTIYRHWPGKLELVEDAFRTLKAPVVVPDQGSLRDRIVAVIEQVACLVPPALLLKGADRKHPLRKRALPSAILAIPSLIGDFATSAVPKL